MFCLGITGGIGSGKTLVCQVLEKLGAGVYYADLAARRLLNEDAGLKAGIMGLFGPAAYPDGKLDRRFLAGRVFSDPGSLKALNDLVHPRVQEDFRNWSESMEDRPYVVEEAAILFESGAWRFMDLNVAVIAPPEIRVRRVMHRDRIGRKEVEQRMAHQLSEEELKQKAGYIIRNDGNVMLLPQVITLHEEIINKI